MKFYKLFSATLLTSTALFANNAFAVDVPNGALPGFYLGLQGGYTQLDYSDNDFSGGNNASINGSGLGGRAYLGYQLNRYFGAEAGYTLYDSASVNGFNGNSQAGGDIRQQAIDVVLKGTLPLVNSGFNAYGKAGVAFVRKTVTTGLRQVTDANDADAALFTAGAGASYNITPHVPIDFSYTYTVGNSSIASSMLGAVGIAYYFG